ncbi:MAG: HGxxPAAW family protein [Brachybacterium sp.]|nr:HGxxPAAW family protein [Brachybacterium sp.]
MTKTYTVPPAPPQNHGKTPAAWVMFLGVVIGFLVAAIGFVLSMMLLMIVGGVMMLLTILISSGMALAGMGQPRAAKQPR